MPEENKQITQQGELTTYIDICFRLTEHHQRECYYTHCFINHLFTISIYNRLD